MAYRRGESAQMVLFPDSLDKYVAVDDPVRVYKEFAHTLDLTELGMSMDEYQVGNPSYHPRAMCALLLYSYAYGWRSSRKIERALHHNVSFMWLMDLLKPDHKTIAKFRRDNKAALKKILTQCARLCVKLDIIAGNTLFVDGTKVRANASRKMNMTKKSYAKMLIEIDKRIDEILNECECVDNQEAPMQSMVKLSKELDTAQKRKVKIEQVMQEFKAEDTTKKTVNSTDTESRIMHSVQGSHASYNVQSVVDEKHGLIVHAELTNASVDYEQLPAQIKQAEKVTQIPCQTACADSGYADADALAEIDHTRTQVVVPTQQQASGKEPPAFDKSTFTYDKEHDEYICPQGHRLKKSAFDKGNNQHIYRITSRNLCHQCKHYGVCTVDKKGRTVKRLVNEAVKERIAAYYDTQEGQDVYARRKRYVEHPFGHLKRNLGITQFLLRRKDGGNAEISLGATCFNIARMITIFGSVQNAIVQIQACRG